MRMIAAIGAMIALSQLTGCLKARDAKEVSFSDNSQDAYLLISMGPAPAPYLLRLNAFDAEDNHLSHSPTGMPVMIDVDASEQPKYLAKRVEPGDYVISGVNLERMWGACFRKNTRQFHVNAGDAVFLGEFHPKAHLEQIDRIATESGDTARSVNNIAFYEGDDIIPPQITRPGPATPDFLLAKHYEETALPFLHGRLQPVIYKPAKYEATQCIFW